MKTNVNRTNKKYISRALLQVLLIIMGLILCQDAYTKELTSEKSGYWNQEGIWKITVGTGLPFPEAGDTIIIKPGDKVIITENMNYEGDPMYILVRGDTVNRVNGILHFENGGAKISLPCGSIVNLENEYSWLISTGPGAGLSETLKICDKTLWAAKEGDIQGPRIFGEPLPVELLSFGAEIIENSVALSWSTASEINNDFFTVERSNDGICYEEIMMIDGAGNSNEVIKYRCLDNNPENGISYYKLKQTDFDGKYSYSDIIVIAVEKKSNVNISVYPNPSVVGEQISFEVNEYEDNCEYMLLDQTGKVVVKDYLSFDSKFSIENSESFTAGIYFLIVKSDNSMITKKIIKN